MDASELVRGRKRLGGFELVVCSDGDFKLDGGAMFGVVPKTLWEKRIQADAKNQVSLGMNSVVVRTGSAVVVIETGAGNKQPQKMKEICELKERLPASYAAAGVRLEEVTHVVNTHLHFDHCGWNTTLLASGEVVPTFPNATYFAAAGELAHGRLQLDRDKVSYISANYDPVIAAGQMTVIDPGGVDGYVQGDARLQCDVPVTTSVEICEGVWVETFPGHTATMLGVHIESCGEHAVFIGDLMPTRHHVDPTWVMGYDLDPLTCIENKKAFLKRAMEGDWLVLFPHDHEVPMGRVELNEKGKPVVQVRE